MCKAHSHSVPNLLLDQTLVWNGSVCLGCTSQYYFEHEVATSITILQDIPKILQRILLPKNYPVGISFPVTCRSITLPFWVICALRLSFPNIYQVISGSLYYKQIFQALLE